MHALSQAAAGAAYVSLFLAPVRAFVPQAALVRVDFTARWGGPRLPPSATACSSRPMTRVDFLRSAGVIVTTAAGVAALPRCTNAETFVDDALGLRFETPEGWERNNAEISGRRKMTFFKSPKIPGANAFVVCTPVQGDYTTLGSFGSLDEVSKTVLPEGEGVTSTLVDSYRQGASYVYDYIVTQKDRPETHIKTMWLLFPQAGQLATITAQVYEADFDKVGKAMNDIIASVKTTK